MIHRRFIARLAIALLLFMQLAVAAYACPGAMGTHAPSTAMGGPTMATETGMDMAGGSCMSLDQSDPNLCLQYGQQESQTTGQAAPPVPLAVDLPLLMVVPAVEFTFEPALPDVLPEFLARTTAPPLSIRFGVFRS